MFRALLVFAFALSLAAAISLLAPRIAFALYEVDIVGSADTAVQYVSTVVAIFSALLGGGAAFLVHDSRQRRERAAEAQRRSDERSRNVRASAIALKSRLQFVTSSLLIVTKTAIDASGEKVLELYLGKIPSEVVFANSGADEFIAVCEKLSANLVFDVELALRLADLNNYELTKLLSAQTVWEHTRVRLGLTQSPAHEIAGGILANVLYALDDLFKLNESLNTQILDIPDDRSFEDWLKSPTWLPR